jgi:hypothetical protein
LEVLLSNLLLIKDTNLCHSDQIPGGEYQNKGKEKEPDSTSSFERRQSLDLFRIQHSEEMKTTPLSPALTREPSEGLPSPQALESNKSQIASFRNDSSARDLLREIHARGEIHQRLEIRQRLIRITGERDFLEKHPQHPEVVKMQDALTRKNFAWPRGNLSGYYSARCDLVAAETALTQEAHMKRSLANGLKGLEFMESRLNANEYALHDTVMKSIAGLNKDLSRIQAEQDETLIQWKKINDDIDQCVVKLGQLAPDLPLPELDKALVFPKGKTKEKDEQSDKTEKEAKKGEYSTFASTKQEGQLSTPGAPAESLAKTTTSQTLELSAEAKTLHREFKDLLLHAQNLHRRLTSLNNQWDNFAERRKSQMDQLKASQDLQSRRFNDAMTAMTVGADKGKSDIAAAMKYGNRLVALAALSLGGGGLRLRM